MWSRRGRGGKWRRRESNQLLLGAGGVLPEEPHPRVIDADGWSRTTTVGDASSTTPTGASMQRLPVSVVARVLCPIRLESRTMLSKPLAYPSTLDHRPPDALSGMVDVLRGGALEPEPRALGVNWQAKAEAKYQHPFLPPCGRSLSPSGGASIRSRPFQAEHHLVVVSVGHLLKRRRRPGGSPSTGSECA